MQWVQRNCPTASWCLRCLSDPDSFFSCRSRVFHTCSCMSPPKGPCVIIAASSERDLAAFGKHRHPTDAPACSRLPWRFSPQVPCQGYWPQIVTKIRTSCMHFIVVTSPHALSNLTPCAHTLSTVGANRSRLTMQGTGLEQAFLSSRNASQRWHDMTAIWTSRSSML